MRESFQPKLFRASDAEASLQERIAEEKELQKAGEENPSSIKVVSVDGDSVDESSEAQAQLGDDIELIPAKDIKDVYTDEVGDLELADKSEKGLQGEKKYEQGNGINAEKETLPSLKNGKEIILKSELNEKETHIVEPKVISGPEDIRRGREDSDDDVIDAEFEVISESESLQQNSERNIDGLSEDEQLQQLLENVEFWHSNLIDAQKKFSQTEGRIGTFNSIKQRLGLVFDEYKTKQGNSEDDKKQNNLGEVTKEYRRAKVNLEEAEKSFQYYHEKYSRILIKKKQQELIDKEKERLKSEGIEDSQADDKLKSFQKKDEKFHDEIRNFIISEKVVSAKREKEIEPGKFKMVEEKISLFEDMNERLKAVNDGKIECMNERDKNMLQKSWDWYRKLSKKDRMALGIAVATPLAAGAALAGGATMGMAIGVAAMTGGRKIVSSIVGGVAGVFTFKKTKEYFIGKRGEIELKKEKRMVKEFAERDHFDMYLFMKDRLAQDRNDNLKSMAAAGIVGFVAGAGTRSLFNLAGFDTHDFVDQSGDRISVSEQIKIDKEIRDHFYAKVDELNVADTNDEKGFNNGFVAWEETKKSMIKVGQENSHAFKELEKVYGEDAYKKFMSMEDHVRQEHSGVLDQEQDVYTDWKEIMDGTGEFPPQFSYLAMYESFKDFVEEKYGNFDSDDRSIIQWWEEYRKLVPEEAKKTMAFSRHDHYFHRFEGALSDKIAMRYVDAMGRQFSNLEKDYELRVHGAQLVKKMGLDIDTFANRNQVKGGFEAGVLTQINGHKVPLELLSEADREKVLSARKLHEAMSGNLAEKVEKKPLQNLSVKEEISEKTPEQVVAEIEAIRKKGKMPSLRQMRDYKHARIAIANEESAQELEKPDIADTELVPEHSSKEAETGKLSKPSSQKDSSLKSEKAGSNKNAEVQEVAKERVTVAGVGEEESTGYEKDLQTDGEMAQEEIADFDKVLEKDDKLWDVLEEKMDGDQDRVASSIIDFKKSIAENLIENRGLSQKDAQDFIHWRFQNLHHGDIVALREGHLDIRNFANNDNVNLFIRKFVDPEKIVTSAEEGTHVKVVDVNDLENEPVEKNSERYAKIDSEFKRELTSLQLKKLEQTNAEKFVIISQKLDHPNTPISPESIGRKILLKIQMENGMPKKGESVMQYLSRYEKTLTISQKHGLVALVEKI